MPSLPAGIYAPTPTFFLPTQGQELDIPTHIRHIEFLAKAGLQGVTVQGSTGEAVTLTRDERKQLITSAEKAFHAINPNGIIIAGTVGAQSTQQAIELCQDASEAGADFALVLPASYYPAAMSVDALQGFFEEVASASPIPVLIYSYPGVSSGLVLDSDLILRLAQHPNIAGVKHTDHDVGRIGREAHAGKGKSGSFTVLGGASDYLLGTLAVGGQGAITGLANIAPRTIGKAYELALAGKWSEAKEFAGEISRAEWTMGKGNILGTKYAISWANSYPSTSAACRRPLLQCPQSTKDHIEKECADLLAIEGGLETSGYVGTGLRASKPVVNGSNGVNGTKANGEKGLLDTIKQKVAAL